MKAFAVLGGSIYPREDARFEVTHVPAAIRERDRRITVSLRQACLAALGPGG